MTDLSAIKNEKLRLLLQESAKFQILPKDKQHEHIEKIKDLSYAKQEEVCKFLMQENGMEKAHNLTNEEKLKILNQLYEEVVALEQKFTKLLKKDPELKEQEREKEKMANILDDVKNP
ncbi:MAG: hypothetical protein AAB848_03015 [Patescibacteria group bacterium]